MGISASLKELTRKAKEDETFRAALAQAQSPQDVVAIANRAGIALTLKELQAVIDDLVQDGFKTENASEAYSTAYSELTTSLDDAAEAVNDMAQALDRMADSIRDKDSELAGG